MKNILMLLAMSIFVAALFLLAQVMIEYGVMAMVVAIACVLSSCLIDKEEECNNLRAQQAATHIRAQRMDTEYRELRRRFDIIEDSNLRYERMCDNLRILPYTTEGWNNRIYRV